MKDERATGIDDDPYNLSRFLQAQLEEYEGVLAELHRGKKESHWMWYVFPQFNGLGFSSMSKHYAIKSIEEADAYLRHPVLGMRLLQCADAVLQIHGRSAAEIFGSPDESKLRSSATLFVIVSPPESVFEKLLDKYFQGDRDSQTLRLIAEWSRREFLK